MVSQSPRDEERRYTKNRISTEAVDGLLTGTRGKYAAIEKGIVQCCSDHQGEPKNGEYGALTAKWECQNRREAFELRNILEQAEFPLTILTDNLEGVQGSD